MYSFLERLRYLLRLVLPKIDGSWLRGLKQWSSRYDSEYLPSLGSDATRYVAHNFWLHRRTAQALSYRIADIVQLSIVSIFIGSAADYIL